MCGPEAREMWRSIGGLNILESKVQLTWNGRGPPRGKGRKWRSVNGEEEEKAYQSEVEGMQSEGVIEEVQEVMVRYFNHTFLLKKDDFSFYSGREGPKPVPVTATLQG
jgi:hypothetical protein